MLIQLPDKVENIVGKGEITDYEQFLLFPQCVQKLSVVENEYLWSEGLSDNLKNVNSNLTVSF